MIAFDMLPLCINTHILHKMKHAADMQEIWAGHGPAGVLVRIPHPDDEVIGGIRWGVPEIPNCPAYWAIRCRWEEGASGFLSRGQSLAEEVGFCILGGFGILYEVNAAAFEMLGRHGAFELDSDLGVDDLGRLLKEPLEVGGRTVRYRFPNQRARRLFDMRSRLRDIPTAGICALELRDVLQAIDGIGPKTASWIVRNILDSDDVAIIDVHILRACRLMGVFPERVALPRDYAELERIFLAFANALGVRPSVLDSVMWTEMRSLPARKWESVRSGEIGESPSEVGRNARRPGRVRGAGRACPAGASHATAAKGSEAADRATPRH